MNLGGLVQAVQSRSAIRPILRNSALDHIHQIAITWMTHYNAFWCLLERTRRFAHSCISHSTRTFGNLQKPAETGEIEGKSVGEGCWWMSICTLRVHSLAMALEAWGNYLAFDTARMLWLSPPRSRITTLLSALTFLLEPNPWKVVHKQASLR